MSIQKLFNRLRYIDHMIKYKATGDLETFALKNNVSKTTMCAIISDMKALGFPIKYDRDRKTYFYEEDGQMVKALFLRTGEILSKDESSNV